MVEQKQRDKSDVINYEVIRQTAGIAAAPKV